MSRFDRSGSRVSATPSVQSSQNNVNISRLNQITSVAKILGSFFSIKQKNNLRSFLDKCKKTAKYNKKRGNITASFLNALQNRKQRLYLSYSFRKLLSHRDQEIKRQTEHIQTQKNIIKSKSVFLLGVIFKRIWHKKLKNTIATMLHQTKARNLVNNYRNRHILRILNGLYFDKLRLGFDNLKSSKLIFIKKRNILRRLERMFSTKRQYNMLSFFARVLSLPSKKQANIKDNRPKVQNKNSRVRQVVPEKQIKKVAQIQNLNQQERKKEYQDKNKKLQQQIQMTQQNFDNIANQHRNEIADLQAQHERLKFNSGLLESANQDLQSQITNRQKKIRKGMPISQLWQRIYSNFLLLIKKYEGQILPKQLVLQHLLQPLTPLSINIQNLKAQNQVLTNLLQEYKKFFEEKPTSDTNEQNLLPYDILIEKNKFLYIAVQTLIRQGLGSEAQIKQLEIDLQNASKQS